MTTDTDIGPAETAVIPPDIFDDLPPALAASVDDDDIGQCNNCGIPVRRPTGNSPTGRKKRIPKYCNDCKSAVKSGVNSAAPRRRKSSNPDIAEGITNFHVMIGMAIMTKDPELGLKFVGEERLKEMLGQAEGPVPSIADAAGAAWAHVATSNQAVADFLTPLVKTSVWTEVASAYSPAVGHVLMKKPRPKFLTKLSLWRRSKRKAVEPNE